MNRLRLLGLPCGALLGVVAALAGSAWAAGSSLPACTTGATGTLQPVLADFAVNQGLPSYGQLARGKDSIVRVYLTLPTACSGSIAITGASLALAAGSSYTLAPQAGSASGSLTTAVQTTSAADPTFFVPAADLLSGDGTASFSASFTLTVTYTQGRSSTPLTKTFAARTATVEKKTNALRMLVVPMGDAAQLFSSQFPATAQTDVQNAMSTLSRLYPVPAGLGDLSGATGGVRYTIDLATLLNLQAVNAVVPGTYRADGHFCGGGASWPLIKGQLAQYLQAWNTQNPAATADRAVGAVHQSISDDPTAGCAEGMSDVGSNAVWVRAVDDQPALKPAVVSRTGALLAMELEHTFGGVPAPRAPNYHSVNIAADVTAPGKAYNVSSKQPLGAANHSAMRYDTSTGSWDNSDTLLEQQDFADLLCWLTPGGATNSECTAAGTTGSSTGVAAGPQLVGAGTTNGTAVGTQAETYYATDVAPQAGCPQSVYRVIQVAGTTNVLANAGVCVAFQGSIHLGSETLTPPFATGVFSFSVEAVGATNVELVKVATAADDPLTGTILYSRDKIAAPTVTSVSFDHSTPFGITAPTIPPKPDVVFLADTTGSMGGAIDNVKASVASIMGTVRTTQPLAQFGAADYKDFSCGDDVPYTLGSAVTSDTAAVQTAINAWLVTSPFSGCDTPEAQLNALYRLATDSNVGWRADSSRIIAWFGDAPGHDPSGGHSLADVTAALTAAPGTRIVAVSVNGGGLDATGQATALVNATHGTYQQGVSNDQVAAAITSGLQNLPVTLKPSTSCDQEGVTLSLGAQVPANPVSSGASVRFDGAVAHVAAGTPAGTYTCTAAFTINGHPDSSLTTQVSVVVPGGSTSSTADVAVSSPDPNRVQVDLFYHCGGVYYPVAVGLTPDAVTDTTATFTTRFDSTNACGGGTLIAFANDGFTRSAGVETTPEGGSPTPKPPNAAIYAPTSSVFEAGSFLAVYGVGKSPQTGQLPPGALHWTLTGGAGQIAQLDGPSGDIVLPRTLAPGDYTLTLTATDAVGTGTDSRPVTIVAPPSLTISHSPSGATTTSGSVTFTVSADSAIGLTSVACTLDSADVTLPPVSGTPYSATFTATGYGLHTAVCQATDTAGYATSASDQSQIVYGFNGFLSPIDNPPVTNLGKGGRTYPVKWQLMDSLNQFVTSTSVVTDISYRSIACADLSPMTEPIETTTSGGSVLRYDSGANQFVYNWQTPSASTTRCYELDVSLNDGTVHSAFFRLS